MSPNSTPRLRGAVIGLGRMGSTFDDEMEHFSRWPPPHAHATCYRASPEVELVGGSDPYDSQRDAFARKWSFDPQHLYADYHELLERERPDIVSVCTSARPRAAIVRDIVQAGVGVKAIWAEKPMALTLAEADAMVSECRAAGVVLAIGASRCWDATYNRIRELIDFGHVGDVLHVTGMGHCGLSHNGSHLLTLVAFLAGGAHARCTWVFGQAESDQAASSDDDLSANGMLQFDNGPQAFIRTTDCGAAEWEFEVVGTAGRLRAVNDGEEVEFWRLEGPLLPGRRRELVRHVFPRPFGAASANARTLGDIVRALETGKEPNCNGEAARQALEIAIALRQSHRLGGVRVELPLTDRSLRLNSMETLRGDEPAAVRRAQAAAQPAGAA